MTSGFTKALVIGALSTLGALAWSGCGSGEETRYYCDNGGCFSCDAYGCSSVKPPSKKACTSNASCPSGVCTTAGCTEICTSDATCPRGNTCQSGLCAEPGKPVTPLPQTDGGPGPDSGPGPTPVRTCPEVACGGSTVCVSGVCTSPENACQFSSECEDGKVCAEGACLTPCSDTNPCQGGAVCKLNVCQPEQPTGGDGGTGPVSCTVGEDAPCGAGNYCNNGVCAVDNRPKPKCQAGDTCGGTAATPKKCLAGFCKFTCENSAYCRQIDIRIGVCAKDGVCRSASEAEAACTGPGTCAAGKSCIDNQCK